MKLRLLYKDKLSDPMGTKRYDANLTTQNLEKLLFFKFDQ